MSERIPIIIDTDPGVGVPGSDADDPIALLYALGEPRLDLVAVTTTFGNCPPALAARGAAAVLAAAGRPDIPIGVGSDRPLSGVLDPILVEAYRGPRGRAGRIPLPDPGPWPSAVDLIRRTVHDRPGEVTIVAIGPQTNVAQALAVDPTLAAEIRSIVYMGGGLGLEPTYGAGNITPVAECNMYFDPQAAAVVLGSGIDLTMVGLDVTNPATGTILAADTIRALAPTSPAGRLLQDVCATYLDAPMFHWGDGCVLYDPLAVVVAAGRHDGVFEDMPLRIELDGPQRGRTLRGGPDDPIVHVMTEVDGTAAVDHVLRTIHRL